MNKTQRIIACSLTILSISYLPSNNVRASQQPHPQNSSQTAQNVKNEAIHNIQNPTGEQFINIAHRGASAYAPENTLASYDKSHNDIGASYIELDLQMTKDGHLIAMHDTTVDRTTNGTGKVEAYTLKELKELDAGSKFNDAHPQYADPSYEGAKIPTLDEILDRYGTDAHYYIDTKSSTTYPGIQKKLIAQLAEHNLLSDNALKNGHVVIQSFSENALHEVQRLNNDIPLIRLLNKDSLSSLSQSDLQSIATYASGLGVFHKDLNSENIKNIKNANLLVHTYTVNSQKRMQQLNDLGVDGICTNYPDIYNTVITEDQ